MQEQNIQQTSIEKTDKIKKAETAEGTLKQQTLEKKIENILKQLTLEEKIGMIHGAGLFRTEGVKRLGIPSLKTSDGPMGVRAEFEDAAWINLNRNDDDVTYLPSNSAIAATWNPELAKSAGRVLGEESRGRGKDMILAPGINIQRVPECGRNFEYMSEDPRLTARMAVPLIQGIQESDVAACVKHFALNQQETERLWVNVEVSEEALRELYLPGFEAAVREGYVQAVMGAYNLYHGKHCCENRALLNEILRKEWGFDGIVISDWGAVHDTDDAVRAALDIEMSVTPDFDEYCLAAPLLEKIRSGLIDEEIINVKVRNILRVMYRIHAINEKVKVDVERVSGSINTKEHQECVRAAAEESIILLKNEDRHLPIDPKAGEKILVVGDNAVRRQANGGGSAEVKALYEITPLLGIRMLLGGNAQVSFSKGYEPGKKTETERNWQEDSLKDEPVDALAIRNIDSGFNEHLAEEAIQMAAEADRVIFIGGLNHDHDIEGHDRTTLKLPYGQDTLISRLLDVNENITVVMMSGSPVDMSEWKDRVRSLVWLSYAGMEGGYALAEILFGNVNPSGHLAQTLPYEASKQFATNVSENDIFPGRSLMAQEKKQMKAHLTQSYREGRLVGYRYYDKMHIPVQFPFGFGLSYTEFELKDPVLQIDEQALGMSFLPKDAIVAEAAVTVKNTGTISGKIPVQLYVGRQHPDEAEPVRELKAFEKILLSPQAEKKVRFNLKSEDISHFDPQKGCFVIKADTYSIYAGKDCKDLLLCGLFTQTLGIKCLDFNK